MRSEEVSLVSNWWNLVCSSSIPNFLARNRYFLARKYTVNGIYRTENPQSREEYRRVQKSREQYSTVQYSRADQSREEKKRVDITAEQNKIEN